MYMQKNINPSTKARNLKHHRLRTASFCARLIFQDFDLYSYRRQSESAETRRHQNTFARFAHKRRKNLHYSNHDKSSAEIKSSRAYLQSYYSFSRSIVLHNWMLHVQRVPRVRHVVFTSLDCQTSLENISKRPIRTQQCKSIVTIEGGDFGSGPLPLKFQRNIFVRSNFISLNSSEN